MKINHGDTEARLKQFQLSNFKFLKPRLRVSVVNLFRFTLD